jgi:hypothetical protein
VPIGLAIPHGKSAFEVRTERHETPSPPGGVRAGSTPILIFLGVAHFAGRGIAKLKKDNSLSQGIHSGMD